MDRIAVISDIHGNMPALDAVLADIRTRGIEIIYCLGDLVGKGPHSATAVDRCRDLCRAIVRGNWDDFIGRDDDNPVLRWHQQQLGEERLRFLQQLPHVIDLLMSGKQIRLFHASQTSLYTRVFPRDSYATHLAMFANTSFTGFDQSEPDVVGYGDIHAPYLLGLDEDHKVLFNCGSVGNPLDEPLASYAILEGALHDATPAPIGMQIRRVPYDIEQAIAQAEAMGMPELRPYAIELRTAVYRGLH